MYLFKFFLYPAKPIQDKANTKPIQKYGNNIKIGTTEIVPECQVQLKPPKLIQVYQKPNKVNKQQIKHNKIQVIENTIDKVDK